MTKSLDTLVPDIYALFNSKKEFNKENIEEFGKRLAEHISNKISSEKQKPYLRMSNLGTKCARKIWYEINKPEAKEEIEPWVYMKFLVGDILEELVLFLAKEAGHDVSFPQQEVELEGVLGHIDGKIDGVLVDVKSASSPAFKKFQGGLNEDEDSFGYLDQLGAYMDSLGEQEGAFVAVDKQLGHITVDRHRRSGKDYKQHIQRLKEILASDKLPPRGYFDQADGASGNRKLGMECGYCLFKRECWPGLRTFLYSNGPRHLTKVSREPAEHITEVS